MPGWDAFVGLTGVVLLFLLALSHASKRLVTGDAADPPIVERIGRDPTLPDPELLGGETPEDLDDARGEEPPERGIESTGRADGSSGTVPRADAVDRESAGDATSNRGRDADPSPATGVGGERTAPVAHTLDDGDGARMSSSALLVNVAASHAMFGSLLAVGAWLAAIPPSALGLTGPWIDAAWTGTLLGVALYLANEAGAVAADRAGIGHSETLRELLAPESVAGWALLLLVVLPVIAGFEELLFRAALVGVVSTAYPVVSPWAMVVVSSAAFGLGHGAQGAGGIVVTTGLGLVLGAAYVVTGSLVVVFVAHYLVNALEFLVHEWLGIDWIG